MAGVAQGCHCCQESRWAQIQRAATQRMLQLGQIKLAVLNLFQLVTAQFKVPMDVARENTEAQLDMVSAAGWWG